MSRFRFLSALMAFCVLADLGLAEVPESAFDPTADAHSG